MDKFVFIKDLRIYGNIIDSWDTNEGMNYIIKDLNGIEHERYEQEFTFVDNIEDSIKKAKCNLPLEKLFELFNNINPNYTLIVEQSMKRDNAVGDMVPYIYALYGINHDDEPLPCIIKDGKLTTPTSSEFIIHPNEYECCVLYYDTDIKDVLFELYMNIVTRLEIKNEN